MATIYEPATEIERAAVLASLNAGTGIPAGFAYNPQWNPSVMRAVELPGDDPEDGPLAVLVEALLESPTEAMIDAISAPVASAIATPGSAVRAAVVDAVVDSGEVALAVERIFLPLPRLDGLGGTTFNVVGNMRGIQLADAANDQVGSEVDFPSGWNTYRLRVRFVNISASSGNVVLRSRLWQFSAGDATNSSSTAGPNTTIASAGQYVVVDAIVNENCAVDPDGPNLVSIMRLGSDGADTLTNAISVMSLLLERTS